MGDKDVSNGVSEDDRKLFIGGLAQEVSEADLKEYFSKYGNVTAATLKMDQMTGRSRGFAFVVFADQGALDSVLSNEHTIKSKKVAVKKAASKQGKIYVGKFAGAITEDEIRNHFEQFGNVVEIQRPVDRSKNSEPKNFCFITYDKEETANHLLAKGKQIVSGQEVEIKKVTVKADGGMRGGMRGGMGGRGGGHGGWGSGGYDGGWGGYGGQGGWGYDTPPGPWPGYGGGYGGGGGGWGGGWGGDGGYGGGGKMGASGGNFRGRGGGRGGRSAPY